MIAGDSAGMSPPPRIHNVLGLHTHPTFTSLKFPPTLFLLHTSSAFGIVDVAMMMSVAIAWFCLLALVIYCPGGMLCRDEMMGLNSLRSRFPHMSASALAAIVAEFKRTGLPSHCKRKHIKKAREMVTNAVTPYGRLHQTIPLITTEGASTQLIVQHPFAMLHMATEGGGEFVAFLERKYDEKPSSRENHWNLVFYDDEITPGSALKADNLRKIQAAYWSFLEFGGAALAKELFWGPAK